MTGTGEGRVMAGTAEMSVGVAVACMGAAVWLLGEGDSAARRASCCSRAAEPSGVGPPGWRQMTGGLRRVRGRLRAEWWSPVAGLVLAVLGASVLPVVLGAAGVPLLRRVGWPVEARRARDRRADAVIALCGALAGEVRAGRQPGEALLRAARDCGGLGDAQATVLAAARFGGDVPGALAAAARQPGGEGLRGLAACWRVAVDQGAGLAAGLDRLAAALRAERDQRSDLRAQLAGARATAVMLAGLPALGLLIGTALGADPLHVLLHTGGGSGLSGGRRGAGGPGAVVGAEDRAGRGGGGMSGEVVHRLGVAVGIVLALGWLARWLVEARQRAEDAASAGRAVGAGKRLPASRASPQAGPRGSGCLPWAWRVPDGPLWVASPVPRWDWPVRWGCGSGGCGRRRPVRTRGHPTSPRRRGNCPSRPICWRPASRRAPAR